MGYRIGVDKKRRAAPGEAPGPALPACLEAQEGTKTRYRAEESIYLQRFKSRRMSPLSCEEKGKCSTARLGAEFPSIGNQPEAHANQWWPNHGGDTPVSSGNPSGIVVIGWLRSGWLRMLSCATEGDLIQSSNRV